MRGANGVRVQPQQDQLNGRQPYPPANSGGFDRSGQHQHNADVGPTPGQPNGNGANRGGWNGANRGGPTTQTYGGPRQTGGAPQAGFMGRPQGVQGQQPPRQTFQSQPPRQTFVAPSQPQRQAQPAQRPAQQRTDGQNRDGSRQ